MKQGISIADAKARFSECVRRAESGDVVVLFRHGKAVAALVPADDVEQLERLRAAGPEMGLSSIAGGWEGSEDLVELIRQKRRSRGRAVKPLD